MKKNISDLQVLATRIIKMCLKNRHSSFVLIIFSMSFYSCGKVWTGLKYEKNHLIREGQCFNNTSKESKISKAIKELYSITIQNFPQLFIFITPRHYNYDNPLILSIAKMEKTFRDIKDEVSTVKNADELFYLLSGSRRFEDQKCSFKYLGQKKVNDIRPYLNIVHHCYKKYQNETCDDAEFINMEPQDESWAMKNALDLCRSVSNESACQLEYKKSKSSQSLGAMIKHYSSRFVQERFDPLFKLRPTHESFFCQKVSANPGISAEKLIMHIKVLGNSFNGETLLDLLAHVEAVWSSEKFSLKFQVVSTYSPGVVTITPSNKGISYVPDNNNRSVYLSTAIDLATMKQVLAHEFGHVLGFPDCYIEFFDNSKRELVYYEIAQKNTNIMCSLKANVQVEDDYFTQLSQNSCLFN